MSQIYEEANMSVHIPDGAKEAVAHCYDLRDEEFLTVVVIDLLTFLPVDYQLEGETYHVPHHTFVIEAMQSCFNHESDLWDAWTELRDKPLL